MRCVGYKLKSGPINTDPVNSFVVSFRILIDNTDYNNCTGTVQYHSELRICPLYLGFRFFQSHRDHLRPEDIFLYENHLWYIYLHLFLDNGDRCTGTHGTEPGKFARLTAVIQGGKSESPSAPPPRSKPSPHVCLFVCLFVWLFVWLFVSDNFRSLNLSGLLSV